jgi:hypothetical protein
MNAVQCGVCGKGFKYPCHLKRHKERKKTCKPNVVAKERQTTPNTCHTCGKTFKGRQGLHQHKLRCKNQEAEDVDVEGITGLETKVEKMIAELSKLCIAIGRPVAPPQTVTNQQIIAGHLHTAPVYNLHINVFGREDTSHIGPSKIQALLDDVLETTDDPASGAQQALVKATMLICSDAEHMANVTCYVPNKKEDNVRVKTESGRWELHPSSTIVPPLITMATNLLFQNQPFTNASKYGDLLKALRDGGPNSSDQRGVLSVLVRNKDLIIQELGALP